MMAWPKTNPACPKGEEKQETIVSQNGNPSSDNFIKDHPEEDTIVSHAIEQYLMESAPVFRELQQLRAKVSGLNARWACLRTVNDQWRS